LLIDVLKNRRSEDLNVFPIKQLSEYIIKHHLKHPELSAKKEQYIEAIENNTKKVIKSNIVHKSSYSTNGAPWENILARLSMNTVYRLIQYSKKLKAIVQLDIFWNKLIKRDLIVPKFSINPKEWYLKATNWPIGSDVWGGGYNAYGQLGIATKKDRVDKYLQIPLSGVVDISASHYNTIFITTKGSAYSCGRPDDESLLDWDISDNSINKLLSRKMRAPAQQMISIKGAKCSAIFTEFIFFLLNNGEIWLMHKGSYKRIDDQRYIQMITLHGNLWTLDKEGNVRSWGYWNHYKSDFQIEDFGVVNRGVDAIIKGKRQTYFVLTDGTKINQYGTTLTDSDDSANLPVIKNDRIVLYDNREDGNGYSFKRVIPIE